jgi:hypothetical protein
MMDEMANRLAMRRKAMSGDAPKAAPPAAQGTPARAAAAGASGTRSGSIAGASGEDAAAAAAATAAAASSAASTGLFRPESMHGFAMKVTKAKKAKDRGDSDDWGSESD